MAFLTTEMGTVTTVTYYYVTVVTVPISLLATFIYIIACLKMNLSHNCGDVVLGLEWHTTEPIGTTGAYSVV